MTDKAATHTVRGQILEALKISYPGGMSDESLLAMLSYGGGRMLKLDVRTHLEYMSGEGKEYVEVVKKEKALWAANLTSRGIDLLEGNIEPDPGIIINTP